MCNTVPKSPGATYSNHRSGGKVSNYFTDMLGYCFPSDYFVEVECMLYYTY